MASRFGSATQRRLDVTNRRREVEKRAARDARRLEGLPEVRPPYRPHRPYKASGTDHKTYYALKIQGGFLLALFSITALARAPFYQDQNAFDFDLADQELIAMEDIVQTRHELPPPPPPRPPVPIEVPDDEILEDDVLQLDATLDLDELIAELPPPPPPAEEDVVDDEPEIFVVVEDPPVMIGGMAALMKEVKYPRLAQQAAVEGRVTVQYVVDEEGNVQDPFVVKGIGAGCDEEALRVVQLMKFEPGRQRGRAVKVTQAIQVRFRLTDA